MYKHLDKFIRTMKQVDALLKEQTKGVDSLDKQIKAVNQFKEQLEKSI